MAKRVSDSFEEYTPEDAARLTIKRFTWLRDPKLTSIIEELIRCKGEPDYRCGLACCAPCRFDLHTSFRKAVLRRVGGKKPVPWLTIAPNQWRVEIGDLAEFDFLKAKGWLVRRLTKALPSDAVLIGSLDVSLNLEENEDKHWRPHFHGFLLTGIDRKTHRELGRAFPKSEGGPLRPVHVKRVRRRKLRKTIGYTCKWFYCRRSIYMKELSDGRRVRRRDRVKLQAAEDRELQLALRNYRVDDLLVLKGVKRKRSTDPTAFRLMQAPKT
jgi:hypothetical protein